MFKWNVPFIPCLAVLSVGDSGDGRRRWDRNRLDHQEQDRRHTVGGRHWILTWSATHNTGTFQTRSLIATCFLSWGLHSISFFSVYRQESIGCYWWTTTLLVSLLSSSPASCASASCMFTVRRNTFFCTIYFKETLWHKNCSLRKILTMCFAIWVLFLVWWWKYPISVKMIP